jgi:hypothetical protein
VAVVAEARGVVAEAVVVARSVAAVPEAVAEAVVAAARAAPEAVVVAAVAPVGRTTLPHLCTETPRPAGPGAVLTWHASFSRLN